LAITLKVSMSREHSTNKSQEFPSNRPNGGLLLILEITLYFFTNLFDKITENNFSFFTTWSNFNSGRFGF